MAQQCACFAFNCAPCTLRLGVLLGAVGACVVQLNARVCQVVLESSVDVFGSAITVKFHNFVLELCLKKFETLELITFVFHTKQTDVVCSVVQVQNGKPVFARTGSAPQE